MADLSRQQLAFWQRPVIVLSWGREEEVVVILKEGVSNVCTSRHPAVRLCRATCVVIVWEDCGFQAYLQASLAQLPQFLHLQGGNHSIETWKNALLGVSRTL